MLKTVKVNKKYFKKLDLSKISSPSYVIDTKVINDNLKIFHKLNTFQLEALSKIVLKKYIGTSELLNSKSTLSKAQKYRYLKDLTDKGFCKRKHNLFYKL